MRGGELIIDLKNIDHAVGVAVKHPGIYGLIESTRKPIRLCNLVIAGSKKQDVDLISLEAVDSTYKAILLLGGANNYNITITNTDDVTISLGE